MGHTIRVIVSLIACLLLVEPISASKKLSEKERIQLADIACRQYNQTSMEGSSLYRFKRKNVIISIVGVKQSPNMQRIAQVKAARSAGEFLQGASNRAVSVYEVLDVQNYTLKDNSSNTESSSTSDYSTTQTEEHFSDKMIQSSLSQVSHMEPLCKIGSDAGITIFAFFTILQ